MASSRAAGSNQVLVDLPSALAGKGISIIFIIITEVVMLNWCKLIGLHYTALYSQSSDIFGRAGEMMVIFIIIFWSHYAKWGNGDGRTLTDGTQTCHTMELSICRIRG